MAFDAGKLPPRSLPKLDTQQPGTITPKAPVTETRPVVVPPNQKESFTAKADGTAQRVVADGARAETPHAPAKNLGWGVEEAGPLRFSGPRDTGQLRAAVDRTLALL